MSNKMNVQIIIAAIATCRYLGTFHPFKYAAWVTKKMVTIISIVIIAYSSIIPSWFAFMYHRWSPNSICTMFIIYSHWAVRVLNAHTYLTMAAIAVVYQRILREAIRIKRQIHVAAPSRLEESGSSVNQRQENVDGSRLQQNFNVMKNFAIIVCTSFANWIPQSVATDILSNNTQQYLQQPHIATYVFLLSMSASLVPVLNPIIYATRFKWFKALMLYVKGTISYRQCEQSMADV